MTLKHEFTDNVLPDSTVWIDYFNPDVSTPEKEYLGGLIRLRKIVCICPVVYQEVLQGARGKKTIAAYTSFLRRCHRGRTGIYQASEYAAEIYRTLRTKGYTIRKPNDCLIAAYCILNNLALLHHDRDFDHIEKHFALKVVH